MPDRKLMPVHEFRRKVICGLHPDTLNGKLKSTVRARRHDTDLPHMVMALAQPGHIDLEIIVDAAEFGHVRAVAALAKAVPVDTAQDYFDRALIGVAVNDYATPEEYLTIAKILLRHGANPEAYENTCRQLAASSEKKSAIHNLYSDEIEQREARRDRAEQRAFHRAQQQKNNINP